MSAQAPELLPAGAVGSLLLDRFDGGLNLRDAASELAANETPDCMNSTLDQRGDVGGRLGNAKVNASALAGIATAGFEWKSKGKLVVQIGTGLYKTTDFVTFSNFATLTTADECAFADFQGLLVVLHKVDGVFTYDDTTWTNRSTTVKGKCLAVWQNKVFASGAGLRVWWSNKGDATVWTVATDFNDIRDVNDRDVEGLIAAQGMDEQGRPGLIGWKQDQVFRIHSAATGEYTTLDAKHGGAGPLAGVSLHGTVALVNRDGIFTTDGVGQLALRSGKLEPLFRRDQLNLSKIGQACAGAFRDRMFFSFPRAGSADNDLELEFHPDVGWIVPHEASAARWYVNWTKDTEKLYKGGSGPGAQGGPLLDGRHIYEAFTGGTDDGRAISSRYQTYWVNPNSSYKTRFHRARMLLRNPQMTVNVRFDYEPSSGRVHTLSPPTSPPVWNGGQLWNGGGLWGPLPDQAHTDAWRLGVGKAASFVFECSSSASSSMAKLLRTGAQPEVGAWSLSEILLEHSRLGRA